MYYNISAGHLECKTLTRKKKATLAEDVLFDNPGSASEKLNSIAIIIIQIPSPKDPHIMGRRRPTRSRKNVGNSEPMMNIVLMTPPRSKARLRSRPTLICKTDVM